MAIHLSLMSPEHLDDYKLCVVLSDRVHLQCQFDPPRPSFYHPHCGLTFTCLQIMGVCLVVALCLAIMFVLVRI